MGKLTRRRNRVEPFVALFWALDIVQYLKTPDPARRHHSTAVHKACPHMVKVGSILNKDALPPPTFPLGMLFIYAERTQWMLFTLYCCCWLEEAHLHNPQYSHNQLACKFSIIFRHELRE